jgi:hypothetical protein
MIAFLLASLFDDLDSKIAPILPRPEEEKWLSIPWRTDLNQARADAARDGKPMFFWIMNGDPMGCT